MAVSGHSSFRNTSPAPLKQTERRTRVPLQDAEQTLHSLKMNFGGLYVADGEIAGKTEIEAVPDIDSVGDDSPDRDALGFPFIEPDALWDELNVLEGLDEVVTADV